MPGLIRTKIQELLGDSSSGADGEVIDLSGIGGNITGVTMKPASGSVEIQGRPGDSWAPVPSSGLEVMVDFDQNKTIRLPRIRGVAGEGTASVYLYIRVNVRE